MWGSRCLFFKLPCSSLIVLHDKPGADTVSCQPIFKQVMKQGQNKEHLTAFMVELLTCLDSSGGGRWSQLDVESAAVQLRDVQEGTGTQLLSGLSGPGSTGAITVWAWVSGKNKHFWLIWTIAPSDSVTQFDLLISESLHLCVCDIKRLRWSENGRWIYFEKSQSGVFCIRHWSSGGFWHPGLTGSSSSNTPSLTAV